MKNVLGLMCLVVLLQSCQKEIGFDEVTQTSLADSLRLTNVDVYYYRNGTNIEDSIKLAIQYNDSLKSVLYTPTPIYNTGLARDARREFFFDANGRWSSEKIYHSTTNTVHRERIMNYDASGRPQQFHYATYSGEYDMYFQYRSVGINTEITVVDTLCADYVSNSYYKVTIAPNDRVLSKVYLPSGLSPYRDSIVFSYDDEGSMTKEVTYSSEQNSNETYVTTLTYQRDPNGNLAFFHYAKNAWGKDFWWFEHDKDYSIHGLANGHWYSMGRPLVKADKVMERFVNGVSAGIIFNDHYVYTNVYDANKNVTNYTCLENGVLIEKWSFKYGR